MLRKTHPETITGQGHSGAGRGTDQGINQNSAITSGVRWTTAEICGSGVGFARVIEREVQILNYRHTFLLQWRSAVSREWTLLDQRGARSAAVARGCEAWPRSRRLAFAEGHGWALMATRAPRDGGGSIDGDQAIDAR